MGDPQNESKRKRHDQTSQPVQKSRKTSKAHDITRNVVGNDPWHLQIFVGTYEKTLHGFQACVSFEPENPSNAASPTFPLQNGKNPVNSSSHEEISSRKRNKKLKDTNVRGDLQAGKGVVDYAKISHKHDGQAQGQRIPSKPSSTVAFTDTFLFNAHMSSLRCLALSPPSISFSSASLKVTLASGSSDERINLYQLSWPPSTTTPSSHYDQKDTPPPPPIPPPRSKELGSLLHHSSPITTLTFPNPSKLLSSSLDSTLAITRTKDYSLLTTIRSPLPPAKNRPSGDTAPQDGHPTGINDFSVHPSLKLMISVSKGERCMRLWNLVTGKKAGVLNFGKEVLQGVGVGRHETGEARRVVWDGEGEGGGGEEFVVGWERGAVVYGVDCVPRVRIVVGGRGDGRVGGGVKVHQMRYFDGWKAGDGKGRCLSVSTEDGRIIFFSTAEPRERDVENQKPPSSSPEIPLAAIIGEIGPSTTTSPSRIKDFKILSRQLQDDSYHHLLVAGSSDGSISIWQLDPSKSLRTIVIKGYQQYFNSQLSKIQSEASTGRLSNRNISHQGQNHLFRSDGSDVAS